MLLVSGCDNLISSRQGLHDFLDFLVVFKILDSKITCGIFQTDVRVFLKEMLYAVDALLEFCTVIDMYMSGKMRI